MAELVDAPASGAGARKGVEVRVLFRAPFRTLRSPDPVPENVSIENERYLARLKLYGAEAFADEEVEIYGLADRLCIASGRGWYSRCGDMPEDGRF